MEKIKDLGTLEVEALADFILANYGPMSHLKLQKLVYYCEAYHLAYFDKSLIAENFEAWVHGPVCRELFSSLRDKSILYSDLGFIGNYNPNDLINKRLSTDQVALLSDVLSELSSWTGIQLETVSHLEKPWKDARAGVNPADKCSNIISKETMRIFYKEDFE